MKKRVGYYKEDISDGDSKPQEGAATEIRQPKRKKVEKGVVANCVCVIVRSEVCQGVYNSSVKDLINAGTEVTIYLDESTDDFYKVTYGDGKDGFIHKSLVERR